MDTPIWAYGIPQPSELFRSSVVIPRLGSTRSLLHGLVSYSPAEWVYSRAQWVIPCLTCLCACSPVGYSWVWWVIPQPIPVSLLFRCCLVAAWMVFGFGLVIAWLFCWLLFGAAWLLLGCCLAAVRRLFGCRPKWWCTNRCSAQRKNYVPTCWRNDVQMMFKHHVHIRRKWCPNDVQINVQHDVQMMFTMMSKCCPNHVHIISNMMCKWYGHDFQRDA